MPILRAVWACFEHVQTALTCVGTFYYCSEMLHPSNSHQMGLQPAGRNFPTLGVSSLPNNYQCSQVSIGNFKMLSKYAAKHSTQSVQSFKLFFHIGYHLCQDSYKFNQACLVQMHSKGKLSNSSPLLQLNLISRVGNHSLVFHRLHP